MNTGSALRILRIPTGELENVGALTMKYTGILNLIQCKYMTSSFLPTRVRFFHYIDQVSFKFENVESDADLLGKNVTRSRYPHQEHLIFSPPIHFP
jgi:hypothetical protein